MVHAGLDGTGLAMDWIDPVFAAQIDPSKRPEALARIEAAASGGRLTPQMELILRTVLGDIDGAIRVAQLLNQPLEPFAMDVLWMPEMTPMRERPEFRELTASIGLEAYWEASGCAWIGNNLSCPGDEPG